MSCHDARSQTLSCATPSLFHILFFIFNAFLTRLLHIIHPSILTLLVIYVKIPRGSGAMMGSLGKLLLLLLCCVYLDDSCSSDAFDALHILCSLIYPVFGPCC